MSTATTLEIPVVYEDAAATMARFPARMGAVRELVGDRALRPARVAPGVTLVAVVGYRYRETPVGPYDEIGVLVPLGLPIRARTEWWIHWLPVNTEEATEGQDIWGFETDVLDISLDVDAGREVWRLSDAGTPVLELHAASVRTRERRRRMVSIMHSRLRGRPLRSEVRVDAIEIGASVRPGAARVVVNDAHPRGRELGRLLLSTRSLALSRMPRSKSTLFAPH